MQQQPDPHSNPGPVQTTGVLDEQWAADIAWVQEDSRSRAAALAVHALATFSSANDEATRSEIMSLWLATHPQDAVAKLRMVTDSNK